VRTMLSCMEQSPGCDKGGALCFMTENSDCTGADEQ
jgi:hypothetical protein